MTRVPTDLERTLEALFSEMENCTRYPQLCCCRCYSAREGNLFRNQLAFYQNGYG